MNAKISKFLGLIVLAACGIAGMGSALAVDYPNFTVNENTVPGTSPFGNSALLIDQFNGSYTEVLLPTILTSTTGTFTSVVDFNASGYLLDHNPVGGLLGCGASICYNIYALLTANGTFTCDNPGCATGDIHFVANNPATVTMYVDPNQDHTPLGPVTGDDYIIATATTLVTGSGVFRGGLNNGDFEIIWSPVTLTTGSPPKDGNSFFPTPRPFFLAIDANGNFTENPLLANEGVFHGSANAFFIQQVPEPGSMALVGLALVGMGFASRRRTA